VRNYRGPISSCARIDDEPLGGLPQSWAAAVDCDRCSGAPINRTPLVSGNVQTAAPASSAKGAASAMPAPNVDREATKVMKIGPRNCTPRATLKMMPSADARTDVETPSFSSGPMQPQSPPPIPTNSMNTKVIGANPPAASHPSVTIASPTAL